MESDKSVNSMFKHALFAFVITFGAMFALSRVLSLTHVDYVIDGDTFVTGEGEHIRLADVDCAEYDTHAGEQATNYLSQTIEGRRVKISKTGKGKYGRTIAEVWVDGKSVGELLINRPECRRWE